MIFLFDLSICNIYSNNIIYKRMSNQVCYPINATEMASSCVKIQRAWRAHYKLKLKLPVCSICISHIYTKNCCVTPCGHEFCLKCLVISLRHIPTCPLCRAPVVPDISEVNNDEIHERSYQTGLFIGRQNTLAEARLMVEETAAYETGVIDGSAIREDELRSAKAEITMLKFKINNLIHGPTCYTTPYRRKDSMHPHNTRFKAAQASAHSEVKSNGSVGYDEDGRMCGGGGRVNQEPSQSMTPNTENQPIIPTSPS